MADDFSTVADAPASDSSSSDWLNTLGSLVNTGANAYKTISGATIAEKQATLGQNPQAKLSTTNTGTAWYKQAWVIPVAIGAGILLVLGLFTRR